MGSKYTKPERPGCRARTDTSTIQNTIKDAIFLSETLDCDCHAQGACPQGEPSMPPLEEFQDKAPQYLYSDCPRRPIRADHQRWTWLEFRPAGKHWRHPHEHGKRAVDDGAAAREFSVEVLRALDSLPASKQRALEHRFGAAVQQLRSNDTAPGQGPDARLVLSLLLAQPEHHTRILVRRLPPAMVDVLKQCTQRAMTTAVARARIEPAATAAGEPQGRHRAEYQAYVEHVVDRWTEHFNVTVDDTGPESICDQVYREAVSSIEQGDHGKRFVTSHNQMMTALVMEALTPVGNPFLHALEMSTPGGSWGLNESNFVAAFGPAFPAISVAIGLFALSMYSQPAGHLAWGGGGGNEELPLGTSLI